MLKVLICRRYPNDCQIPATLHTLERQYITIWNDPAQITSPWFSQLNGPTAYSSWRAALRTAVRLVEGEHWYVVNLDRALR